MQPIYSAEQVSDVSGIPMPTLRFLVAKRALVSSAPRAEGRGSANVFSFWDAVGATVGNMVRRCGNTFDDVRSLMSFPREHHASSGAVDPNTLVVFMPNGSTIVASKTETVGELLARCAANPITIVDFAPVVEAVEQGLRCSLLTSPGATGRAPRLTTEAALARDVELAFAGKRRPATRTKPRRKVRP